MIFLYLKINYSIFLKKKKKTHKNEKQLPQGLLKILPYDVLYRSWENWGLRCYVLEKKKPLYVLRKKKKNHYM